MKTPGNVEFLVILTFETICITGDRYYNSENTWEIDATVFFYMNESKQYKQLDFFHDH